MRALLLEPDPAWLEQRRQRGIDRHDEVWDGVLHVVPSPTPAHQEFELELAVVLRPIVRALGLKVFIELDILDAAKGDDDYRQPDVVVVDPQDLSGRAIAGHAELVAEILSPRDQSREKFAFYARCRIGELWIVDPTTRDIEVYLLRDGAYERVTPCPDGTLEAPRLSLRLQTVDGPRLRIIWADGSAQI
jgi:Uma2 family endonuclease